MRLSRAPSIPSSLPRSEGETTNRTFRVSSPPRQTKVTRRSFSFPSTGSTRGVPSSASRRQNRSSAAGPEVAISLRKALRRGLARSSAWARPWFVRRRRLIRRAIRGRLMPLFCRNGGPHAGLVYSPVFRDASPLAPARSFRPLPALRRGGGQGRGALHRSRPAWTSAHHPAAVPGLRRRLPPRPDAARLRERHGGDARLLRRAGGRDRPHRGATPAPASAIGPALSGDRRQLRLRPRLQPPRVRLGGAGGGPLTAGGGGRRGAGSAFAPRLLQRRSRPRPRAFRSGRLLGGPGARRRAPRPARRHP